MFNSILENNLTFTNVIICLITSILLGLIISIVHMKTSKYSKNFVITLAVLPSLVEVVMIMVNGNLGTSVAVLGAFSLIRFRSIPGNSKEITSVFFAMAIGLAVGMGQIYFAILLTIVISILLIVLNKTNFGEQEKGMILRIVIPEDLNYDNIFNDILDKYTKSYQFLSIKTINLGSLFEIKYNLILDTNNTKELLDELRVKNGNMKIVLQLVTEDSEL